MQEFANLVRQLCGANKELRLICTSRSALRSTLPECKRVNVEQLDPEAAMAALRHYSDDAAIELQAMEQLSNDVCVCNPFALSIVGPLLRDADFPAEAAEVRFAF